VLPRLQGAIGQGGWRGGLVLLLVLGAGFYLGTIGSQVSVHAGVPSSAPGAISIEADGWTYSVPLDGVAWIDDGGSWHDSGRPTCLPVDGTTEAVRFGAVTVSLEGSTWRPVVWVDCR
jgi:hypothetical protein